jgi:hypothetical protein
LSLLLTARVVVLTDAHHITQRGEYRQNIFQDDEGQMEYLSLGDGMIGSALPGDMLKKQAKK